MSPEAYIEAVRAGQIQAGVGGREGDRIVDGRAPLGLDDLDALTAEAYNQGVFDPDVPWAAARRRLETLVSGTGRPAP
jgi:hypothetical protein